MHPDEPSTIAELALIYSELIRAPSTNENMAKIHALEAQMKRLTAEIKAKEAATKGTPT